MVIWCKLLPKILAPELRWLEIARLRRGRVEPARSLASTELRQSQRPRRIAERPGMGRLWLVVAGLGVNTSP